MPLPLLHFDDPFSSSLTYFNQPYPIVRTYPIFQIFFFLFFPNRNSRNSNNFRNRPSINLELLLVIGFSSPLHFLLYHFLTIVQIFLIVRGKIRIYIIICKEMPFSKRILGEDILISRYCSISILVYFFSTSYIHIFFFFFFLHIYFSFLPFYRGNRRFLFTLNFIFFFSRGSQD